MLYLHGLIWLFITVIGVDSKFCGYPFQHLTRWFLPAHYDVDLSPSIMEHSHTGQVRILITASDPLASRRHVLMHAGSNLIIKNVKLFRVYEKNSQETMSELTPDKLNQSNEIKINNVCHDDKYDLLVIDMGNFETKKNVATNTALMLAIIDFEGSTMINGQGLVRVGYDDPVALAESRRILYSKFDRFKAHFVFPCFDDPSLKTTFKLKLSNIAPSEDAISTISLDPDEPVSDGGPNSNRDFTFQRTFPISINKLGFVVGKSNKKMSKKMVEDNVKLNLREIQGFSMTELKMDEELFGKIFETVYSYLDSKYPIRNINIVIYPGIGQAFESHMVALSVIDSSVVNYDGEKNSELDTIMTAKIIEVISRQWYGYIVTQKLDEESWFYDGMVGWLGLTLTDKIGSGIDYGLIFAKRYLSKALRADARMDARPLLAEEDYKLSIADIVKANERPGYIPDAFERINLFHSWTARRGDFLLDETKKVKAINAIRNFEQSCDNFDLIVKNFLKSNRFKFTQAREFMNFVLRSCNWPPQRANKSAVYRASFPLIRADISSPFVVVLSQKRFPAVFGQESSDQGETSVGYHWITPATYAYGNYYQPHSMRQKVKLVDKNTNSMLLMPRDQDITRPGSWIKLNFGAKGFYRVLYSDQLLNSLLVAIQNSIIQPIESFNLLDDALAIFRAGQVGSYYLVNTLKVVAKVDDELVKETSISAFKEVKKLYLRYKNINDGLLNLGRELFGSVYLEHGFDMADLRTQDGISARIQIYEMLARSDYQPIISTSVELFRSPDLAQLESTFHGTVFISASRHGDDHDFSDMIEYLTSSLVDHSEELDRKIVMGLAYAREISRLRLAWTHVKTMSPPLIEQFIRTLLDSVLGQSFLISEVVNELPDLHSKIPEDKYLTLVKEICNQIAKENVMCWSSSSLRDVVGRQQWSGLVESVRETRRQDFHMQQLDINKLVL